jgi:hypothetical protein
LQRISRPSVSALPEGDVAQFLHSDDFVVIGQISPSDQHMRSAIATVAEKYKDRASFGTVDSDGPSSVLCYNNKDDEQVSAADLSRIEALTSLVEACMRPLIGMFTHRTESSYLRVSCQPPPAVGKLSIDHRTVRKIHSLLCLS